MGNPGLADVALFNGAYGVISVKHSIGVGGWTTSFAATLNYFPEEFQKAIKAQQTAREAAANQGSQAQIQTKHEPLIRVGLPTALTGTDVPVEPKIDISADLKSLTRR